MFPDFNKDFYKKGSTFLARLCDDTKYVMTSLEEGLQYFLEYCEEKLETILEPNVFYDDCGRWNREENNDNIEI